MLIKSLKTKFILAFLLLFIVIATFSVWLTITTSSRYQQEVNQKLNYAIAEHIVAETALLNDDQINQKQLKDLFHQLMVFNPSIELYLLNAAGDILSYSAPEGAVKKQRVNLDPINRFLTEQFQIPIKGDDPRHLSRKKVFSVAPIKQADQLTGYLYIILDSEQVDNAVQRIENSQILKLALFVLVFGLLFSFLTGIGLFHWMMKRLARLSQSIKAYQRGFAADAITEIPYRKNGDEIDLLTRSFKEMAVTIESQLDEIQSKDTSRRELIANVSHDLRTPLATLRGYLETVALNQDEISEDKQQEYLSIALKHCTHLSSLVNQLFELARYDAQEIHPEFEAFNLSELIQDLALTFNLRAQQKNITLKIDVDKRLPFVFADISLIERAFENLIENALRHTPKNGLISIIMLPKGERVQIDISDTGQGIQQVDLPYIFDRFYQQEKSRSSPSQSGLGLAIVKRIVELHRGNISVQSEINSGTCFRFSLPVAS